MKIASLLYLGFILLLYLEKPPATCKVNYTIFKEMLSEGYEFSGPYALRVKPEEKFQKHGIPLFGKADYELLFYNKNYHPLNGKKLKITVFSSKK